MIPAAGRDVQCSNCSTTWFQPGPRAADPLAPEVAAVEPQSARKLAEVAVDGPSGAPGAAAGGRPPRRQIDPGVADILREEAAREANLRRAEARPDPVEEQAEMPLDRGESTARSRRLAELDEAAEDAFESDQIVIAVATMTTGSRSELLPDIEEINSTLRATDDRTAGEADGTDYDTVGAGPRRRGQVRRGFFLVLLLALVGLGIYAYSDQIAQAMPQAEPVLTGYVALVDQARFWLDDMARSIAQPSDG